MTSRDPGPLAGMLVVLTFVALVAGYGRASLVDRWWRSGRNSATIHEWVTRLWETLRPSAIGSV